MKAEDGRQIPWKFNINS